MEALHPCRCTLCCHLHMYCLLFVCIRKKQSSNRNLKRLCCSTRCRHGSCAEDGVDWHRFCADSKRSNELNYGSQVIWFANRGHFQCTEILIRHVHVTCWIMNAPGSEIDLKICLIFISDPLQGASQISSPLTKLCSLDTDRHDLWVDLAVLSLS